MKVFSANKNRKLFTLFGAPRSHFLLQSIASLFSEVLAAKQWPMVAEGMSSLEHFAATVRREHQWILQKCLPQDIQYLFQLRLTCTVHDSVGAGILKVRTCEALTRESTCRYPTSRCFYSASRDFTLMSQFYL